ncbi:Clr5 domain-containing protein [Xylariales sp. AK1849]|nr:Clr5 domain-containing protein [Xylariales sp. AK1849]
MINEQPDHWATPEDFEQWRSTITRLYMEEGRGLKDVMDVMEHDHGFFATMKMYKYRLARWNLHKYNKKDKNAPTSREDTSVHTQRRQPVIVATTADYAKAVDSGITLIHSGRIRGKRGKPSSTTKMARLQVRFSVQHRLSTPETFRLPEEVIQLSQQLGSGLIDLGFWTGKGTFGNPESNRWWGRVILSTQFLDLGKYKKAFNILNSSFDHFALLLDNPDPGLLQGAYLVVLQLDTQLAQRFLTFAAEMAAIKLPAKHPLRILLLKLKGVGTQQLRQYAHQILESYLAGLETQLGPSNSGVLLLYENLYDTLDFLSHERRMNFVDSQTIQGRQRRQIERLESLGQIAEAQSARLALSYTYWRHESWEEAEKTNDSVLEWLQAHPKDQHSKEIDLWDSLYLRFRCKEKIGTFEDVKRVGEEYINVMRLEAGPEKNRTIAATGHLQKYYKDRGYLKEAEELEMAIEAPSELSK